MKLLSLNIWGGSVLDPLLEFIERNKEVDIFCLQEVYHNAPHRISRDDNSVCLNILGQIQALLPGHKSFFQPVVGQTYGIACLVREGLDISASGNVLIYENPGYAGRGPAHSRQLQWLKCQYKEFTFHVMNVHGLWNGQGKTDTLARLAQSKKIREFMDSIHSPYLLCGDFNLRPDTESLAMLALGTQNLIDIYGVSSTRTSLYEKEERFADYVFATPEIGINQFEVMEDVVSDHAPLLLDFEVLMPAKKR
tara:strand:+ start:14614 stop:15366 length:753 start_codon:yes stop_codon:yes gene_type:complete